MLAANAAAAGPMDSPEKVRSVRIEQPTAANDVLLPDCHPAALQGKVLSAGLGMRQQYPTYTKLPVSILLEQYRDGN